MSEQIPPQTGPSLSSPPPLLSFYSASTDKKLFVVVVVFVFYPCESLTGCWKSKRLAGRRLLRQLPLPRRYVRTTAAAALMRRPL